MDWFLYDRDLHHERIKLTWYLQQKLAAISKQASICIADSEN